MGAPALAEAITRIEARYGTRAVVRGDLAECQDAQRRIHTGTSLDRVTGGGIRAGEPLAFIGPLTAGKQALALTVAAAAQYLGGMVAWIDPSASFDPLAALHAGVDLERLIVVRVREPEEVLLAGSAVLRSEGFRLAVVDLGPSFASRCTIDDLAPLLPVVRGSPAALVIVAEGPHASGASVGTEQARGRRLLLPTVRVDPIGWQTRFGRTVGWSFAAGASTSSERALFCISALEATPSDLGMRTEFVEQVPSAMEQAS